MVAMVMIMTMTMMVITMTHPLLLLPFEGAATIVVDNEIRSQVHTGCPSLAEGFHNDVDAGDSDDQDEDDDLLYLNSGPVTAPQAVPGKRARGRCSSTLMMMMMLMMVTQHIPTSQIPTRWESDIMMKGGNMTQSNSHHTNIQMFQETIDNSAH